MAYREIERLKAGIIHKAVISNCLITASDLKQLHKLSSAEDIHENTVAWCHSAE